jgi:hypothetical protein
MIQSDNKVRMQAANIRRVLSARHAQGTAVRELLDNLSDGDLVALDARETEAKIARIREKRDAKK